MTYDCCAIYVYCDTIWLGLLREAYVGMLMLMSVAYDVCLIIVMVVFLFVWLTMN